MPFYYLNSKVITIKNNSRIIINRANSLFVIINHHLSYKKKGKASDIFQMYPYILCQKYVRLSI